MRKNIELTEVLAAARGEVPADIVLKGGCIFNSFTGEWEIGDVAIVGCHQGRGVPIPGDNADLERCGLIQPHVRGRRGTVSLFCVAGR